MSPSTRRTLLAAMGVLGGAGDYTVTATIEDDQSNRTLASPAGGRHRGG